MDFSDMLEKNMADESLQKLALDAKSGKEDSFSQIYTATFEKIFRFVFFRVGHKETAEDLTEEIFVNAYTKIHALKDTNVIMPWLYRIAKNRIIDHYRGKKAVEDLDSIIELADYSSSPVVLTETTERQQELLNAIEKLPHEQATILKLKYFEDLDNIEIAAILGKSQGNIRVIQHRAIQALTVIMKQ